MIPLSRPLVEDELWWSGLARHAELVGLNSLVPRHQGFIGNRRSLGSALFPRQLDALIEALDVHLSPGQVIDRHTTMPIFRTFTRPRKVARAIVAMRGNGNAEMALGLTPMEDYGVTLKMCPDCYNRDRANYGTAAWRCCHQAPGAVVCCWHECALADTIVSCRATQFISLTTADSIGAPVPILIPSGQHGAAVNIAKSMHALRNHAATPVDQARLAQLYRTKLREFGLVDDFDRLRLQEFTGAFNDQLGPLLPAIGCRMPDAAERDNWLARLVRRPRSEQSPLRHVLLMLFLKLEVISALEQAAALTPYGGRDRPAAVPLRRSARITEAKVSAKRAEWVTLLTAARPGPIRAQNDNLYSWLWRYDRAWLANTLK